MLWIMTNSLRVPTREQHLLTMIEAVAQSTDPNFHLFDYQEKFLVSCLNKGRVVGLFSRQSGKTTLIALYAIFYSFSAKNLTTLIIAPTDRQAGEMFVRLRMY